MQGEASLKFLLCLWLWRSVSPSYARSDISKQKFEMKKHLNWLNKSAQPAFDHSLLKGIQMKHNYHPEGLFDNNKLSLRNIHILQLWHRYGKCAKGIIPMRMTKEDVVLRESSYKRYGMKKHRTFPFPKSEEHDLMHEPVNAIVYVEVDNYYGAKATINVWKPKIQQQHEKYLNNIEAGWKVSRIYMVTIIQGSSLT
ncbi:hypothetical protein HID58_075414 [Brassica napus]|uniref:Neprosin activation peptide domain-containing protein n=1 Tax=Brassica napus TaxID=3708 RepID=A0ABQ7YL77_BRANA|nr:hypothetical protein HID58_075414 [Brassica napus]